MKYGILFSVVAVLLVVSAVSHAGCFALLLWPAISFGVIASGYFYFGPSVYGKSQAGVLAAINQLILLPYLIYLWSVWHLLRFFKRESAYDQLSEDLYIGRRLISRELPAEIDHVIDLTCEFTEPLALRNKSYYSFPVLDGYVPTTDQLRKWVSEIADLPGTIYIHCAEGHGRTGLFAAALLLYKGQFQAPDEAIEFIKSKRPLVRLGSRQLAVLNEFQESNQQRDQFVEAASGT